VVLAPQSERKLSLPLPWAGSGQWGRWLQQELPAFQAQTRVKIAVENMPRRRIGPWQLEPYHFNNARELNQFPYLTLDTTHIGTWREDLLHFYRQVKPKVAHIHLSNYNGREHQLLHHGLLPLAAFLAELAHDNFEGLVSLELGPISLQADDELKLKQNLHASLAFCQQALISSKPA
jgi:sugar phosphate isomerase/epimerase